MSSNPTLDLIEQTGKKLSNIGQITQALKRLIYCIKNILLII